MSRLNRLTAYLLGSFLGLSACIPTANSEVLFFDDFQSDTSGTAPTSSDLDPEIGTGDIGGSWVSRENTATHIQVLNDTVPANGIAGTNNYVKTTRLSSNSAANSSRLHATGWDPLKTANQLVQLDFSLYQTLNVTTGSGNLTLNLYDAAPPSGNTDTGTIGAGIALTNMDFAASIPVDQWVQVQLIFNTSDTLTLVGPGSVSYSPQTYSFTVNGGSFMDQAGNTVTEPQPFVLPGNVTKFQSIMFKEGNNFNNEFIDNVSLVNFSNMVDGDFNEDGFVDAADYVFWRKNDGSQSGYDSWASNFNPVGSEGSGSSLGTTSSVVPEPTTALLFTIGVVVFGNARGRKHRFKLSSDR